MSWWNFKWCKTEKYQSTYSRTIEHKFNKEKNFLESEASKHLVILLISETKIDESFSSAQFLLNGLSRPYRLDCCANGGGILLYVRDYISSWLLTEYKLQESLHQN